MSSAFHTWACEVLIGSSDPGEVTARLAAVHVAYIAVLLVTIVVPAPYGRYAAAKSLLSGLRFSTRWSWVIQEAPSFLISMTLMLQSWSALSVVQKTLLAAFLTHYFNRSFVFPFRLRGATTTPALPTVMAVGFCSMNGFFQGGNSIDLLHVSAPLRAIFALLNQEWSTLSSVGKMARKVTQI